MRKIFSSKTRWFVALLLAATLFFGFSSCSSDSDDDDNEASVIAVWKDTDDESIFTFYDNNTLTISGNEGAVSGSWSGDSPAGSSGTVKIITTTLDGEAMTWNIKITNATTAEDEDKNSDDPSYYIRIS